MNDMNRQIARWTDAQLQTQLDGCWADTVKTGRNKGALTRRAHRWADAIEAEAARRGVRLIGRYGY
jgi:hypothetical protein